MQDFKQKLLTLKKYLKLYDYAVLFFVLLITLALAGRPLISIVMVAYVYSAFYYVFKNIINYRGFSFKEIFILFVPVLFTVWGVLYAIQNYLLVKPEGV